MRIVQVIFTVDLFMLFSIHNLVILSIMLNSLLTAAVDSGVLAICRDSHSNVALVAMSGGVGSGGLLGA